MMPFAENPRACLGVAADSPLLVCLADPEALEPDAADLAARVLACCPCGTLLFCRVHGADMPALTVDFPKSLPWYPQLPEALSHQRAPLARCLVLEHEHPRDIFSALLPEAAVVLDLPGDADSTSVSLALKAGVPVVGFSPASALQLRTAGLDELVPDTADAFVELAVNMAANPWKRSQWLPLVKAAQQRVVNPLVAAGASRAHIAPPRHLSAAYQLVSYVDVDIEFPDRPPYQQRTRGLDLEGQIGTFYGRHRSGWEFATEALAPLHNPSSVYFESFVERRFAWGNWCDMPGSPILKPWIGVVHVPPVIPEWFGQENTIGRILQTDNWKLSEPYCRGFFTLSEWLRDELRPYTDLPINVLRHPTDTNVAPWSPEAFLANPGRSLVQVGNSYRNLHAMALLPEHPLRRVVLMGLEKVFRPLYEREEAELEAQGLPTGNTDAVEFVDFVPNDVYDALFTENVLFAEYYTASASNLIVECMARATPLLVNPLPAVVEYLGPDYPLYYTSYEEASHKLHDTDLIIAAHEYLCHWNRGILDRIGFIYDILTSDIYRSLDIAEE